MNAEKIALINKSADDPLCRSLAIFENTTLSNLQMTSAISELIGNRTVARTKPSQTDCLSILSLSAFCHQTSAPQQGFETPHNNPEYASPSFRAAHSKNTMLTSPAENLGFPLPTTSPLQAAPGEGADQHHVESPHQRTTSRNQADPSLAAKRSWSELNQSNTQVSSPPSASACLKTEAPEYTEYPTDDHPPVHVHKIKDHGIAVRTVPVQPPAPYLPVKARCDHKPAASSHLRQSKASPPSAPACLKIQAPDNTEYTTDDHPPVHVHRIQDHGIRQSQSPTQIVRFI